MSMTDYQREFKALSRGQRRIVQAYSETLNDRADLTKAERLRLVMQAIERGAEADRQRVEQEHRNAQAKTERLTRQVARVPVEHRPPPPPPPVPISRYVLDCIDCNYPIALDSPKPRVPLCPRCKIRREGRKARRRRERAEERSHVA